MKDIVSQQALVADAKEQPLIEHLIELRKRLLLAAAGVLAIFFVLVGFANPIYQFAAAPLLTALPEGGRMIAIEVISPFLIPIQLVLWLSLFIAVPWVLYQVWLFVAPGLYKREKKVTLPLLFSSISLFYCGMAFAYFIVLPMVSHFMIATLPQGVDLTPDIGKYLNFILKVIFLFGVAFEIPVAIVILIAVGITSPEGLAAKRRYIIMAITVISAIVTPADVPSMLIFGSICIALFEVGLLVGKLITKHQRVVISSEIDK